MNAKITLVAALFLTTASSLGCDTEDDRDVSRASVLGDAGSLSDLPGSKASVIPLDVPEELELDDADDQFSEEATELNLSMAPDPSAGGVCCALCWNRWNYYQMVGVTQNCAYWASAWCSQNGRGGLWDAAWGSCNPPPGGF